MSCSDLTIVRLESSSNFYLVNSCICLPGISLFCKTRKHFLAEAKKLINAVSEGCSSKFCKIWKTVVIEYSLSKVANLNPETL